jgi:hypothetical protein
MLVGPRDAKSDAYAVTPPEAPWAKVDPGLADVAFRYPEDRTTISLNSVCDQYQDQTLEELTKSLMLGLDGATVEDTEKRLVDGIPALTTTTKGRVTAKPGEPPTPVTVRITVLKSRRCVYDIMMVGRDAAAERHRRTYAALLGGFHERPEGGAP